MWYNCFWLYKPYPAFPGVESPCWHLLALHPQQTPNLTFTEWHSFCNNYKQYLEVKARFLSLEGLRLALGLPSLVIFAFEESPRHSRARVLEKDCYVSQHQNWLIPSCPPGGSFKYFCLSVGATRRAAVCTRGDQFFPPLPEHKHQVSWQPCPWMSSGSHLRGTNGVPECPLPALFWWKTGDRSHSGSSYWIVSLLSLTERRHSFCLGDCCALCLCFSPTKPEYPCLFTK